MADEENTPPVDGEDEQKPEQEKPEGKETVRIWKRLFTPKWLAILLGASILLHGIAFGSYQLLVRSASAGNTPEVSLGDYQFTADGSERGQIAGAWDRSAKPSQY